MKNPKNILFLIPIFASILAGNAQTVTLAFTGEGPGGNHVQLNRVVVHNLTRGWSETLYFPDTILRIIDDTGVDDPENENGVALSQAFPNPCDGHTRFALRTDAPENVRISIVDIDGKLLAESKQHLDKGMHTFRVQLAKPKTYLLKIATKRYSKTIKIVNIGHGGSNSVDYLGDQLAQPSIKLTTGKGQTNLPFEMGDLMQYIGFALNNDGSEYSSQTVTQAQTISELITLHFTQTSFACVISTLIDYDGNTYNTVQIGDQCWMRENLRTTHYNDGTRIDLGTDTSFTVPLYYYPNNDSNTVPTHGFYYNWKAVMGSFSSSNTIPSEVEGICPKGWHIPSDAEWYQLINYVSSQSQFYCDNNSNNIAKALAATSGWYPCDNLCTVGNSQNANNATGFEARPSGCYYWYWDHYEYGYYGWAAAFWSCTEDNSGFAWIRDIDYYDTAMDRVSASKSFSYSIRCLLNN